MNENKKQEEDIISPETHPTIIESEDKEIPEKKPPNGKIVYFNLEED